MFIIFNRTQSIESVYSQYKSQREKGQLGLFLNAAQCSLNNKKQRNAILTTLFDIELDNAQFYRYFFFCFVE